jgi:hypothetical protein
MTHPTPDRAVTFGIATARQSQPVASERARPAQGDVSMSNDINLRRRRKPAQGASTIGHEQPLPARSELAICRTNMLTNDPACTQYGGHSRASATSRGAL